MSLDPIELERTLSTARQKLLEARTPSGHWEGELSSSALSTATGVCALELFNRTYPRGVSISSEDFGYMVCNGLAWLANHQNADGGWGDTVDSPSNISTTALCWAALLLDGSPVGEYEAVVERADAWLTRRVGELTAPGLARAIHEVYGKDRTFSVPILTMCILAGRFGDNGDAWGSVPALPFELAVCPHKWFQWIGLPVVSYALPALIAVGQARHYHRPTRNPLTWCLRRWARQKTLSVLESIQPASGGFIEAVPLTSFVVMSLASIGQAGHTAAGKGAEFLAASVREDGSWPIDTNLATWVTTLSINALEPGPCRRVPPSNEAGALLRGWLLGQQHLREHPYTHSAPGGWAWTDLSGGVPDADDTSGALLSLYHLAKRDESGRMIDGEVNIAVEKGVRWLLDLQNKDGGIPTFCRGWGRQPFDRSCADLTAHALRAWDTWREHLAEPLQRRVDSATSRAIQYLAKAQRGDGAWIPLWFGSQSAPNLENPLYGTSRTLRACQIAPADVAAQKVWASAIGRAVGWVLSAQNSDGGWGGAASASSTIEETALAVEALGGICRYPAGSAVRIETVVESVRRGVSWLIEHTDGGTRFPPAPIGLYFAKLWYFDRLYPLIFTVAALEQVRGVLTER